MSATFIRCYSVVVFAMAMFIDLRNVEDDVIKAGLFAILGVLLLILAELRR